MLILLGPTLEVAHPTGREPSQAKIAMRPEPYKLENVFPYLTVDQHEIRPEMAIPMILPVACQRMIEIARWQGSICHEQTEDLLKKLIHRIPVARALLYGLVVLLELRGPLNRPHSGRP